MRNLGGRPSRSGGVGSPIWLSKPDSISDIVRGYRKSRGRRKMVALGRRDFGQRHEYRSPVTACITRMSEKIRSTPIESLVRTDNLLRRTAPGGAETL